MSEKFSEFYKELNDVLKKYSEAGLRLEELLGGVESIKASILFQMTEEYKRCAVVESWEATKKQFEPKTPDLPLVEATEDN